ncbi:MAG TPA: carbonic anhydrase family protein [Thermoanaerobaculia bacterium]|nr:carbonic anhydrase family protein [Thermoanaerobaculia bacterium]
MLTVLRRAAAIAVALMLPALAVPGQVQTKESQAAMTPSKALDALKAGNARFLAGKGERRDLKAQVAATASGQYPFAAILSCMDSRASAELVLDQGIGDIFSIRVAGNIVDTDDLGSLEYAVAAAGAKLIVVMGHTSCGAVKGAIDDVKLGNLTELLAKIQPAVHAAGPGTSKDKAYVTKVAEQNVRLVMKEIRSRSAVIAPLLSSGKVGMAGAIYDVETGRVAFLAD